MLLPACTDDYVSADNPVRAIDAWVNTLNLGGLGFKHTEATRRSGQPAYDPAILLKLYLYGYQCGIRSSRKLEKQTCVNLEVIWLCQGAQPSYKTIADFRKDNIKALKAAQREFVRLCGELSLFGAERVAIDGSFVKANASKSGMYTAAGLERDLEKVEQSIARYHRQLDEADRQESGQESGACMSDPELSEKLARLEERQAELKRLEAQLKESDDKQVSTVDPDARLMTKRGKTVGGYNAQIAVDDKHKLIAAQEVTQDGNDLQQLAPMTRAAQDALGHEEISVLADSGYCSGEQIRQCEAESATVYVSIPEQPNRRSKDGRFGSQDFRYDSKQDVYVCPAGQQLALTSTISYRRNRRYHTYRNDAKVCGRCEQSDRCLSKNVKSRHINRWEHEAVMDRHRQRMEDNSGTMRDRGALVEHPFGTLKRWAGMDHFLMCGLEKCQGEFSLMTLGYNFKRVLGIVGAGALMSYCAQNPQAV